MLTCLSTLRFNLGDFLLCEVVHAHQTHQIFYTLLLTESKGYSF